MSRLGGVLAILAIALMSGCDILDGGTDASAPVRDMGPNEGTQQLVSVAAHRTLGLRSVDYDTLFDEGSDKLSEVSSDDDYACCIELALDQGGGWRPYGEMDVPDETVIVLTREDALDLISEARATFVVVSTLMECAANGNLHPWGCALISGPSALVVDRFGLGGGGVAYDEPYIHEFGHLQGLEHINPPNVFRYMSPEFDPEDNVSQDLQGDVSSAQCDALKGASDFAEVTRSLPGGLLCEE